MIERSHIEQILKLNGLDTNSPDDEIKSLLISARWHEEDVEAALVILREDPKDKSQHIDTFHKVFRSDDRLSPDTLNAILGIDVEVASISNAHKSKLEKAYRMQIFSIAITSILIACSFLFIVMWYMKSGIFSQI